MQSLQFSSDSLLGSGARREDGAARESPSGHLGGSNDSGSHAALSLFRFSLALMVMAIHLSAATPPQTGRVAVEAFFCISGFLISMVANGRYAERPAAFLTNRFLRIYPTYWLCLIFAFFAASVVPLSTAVHPSFYLPRTASDVLANIGIFGLTQETPSRLLPAAWSLHTELWFYLVIGLITAKRPRLTLVMLALSLTVTLSILNGMTPLQFYGTPLGNAFAFFLGSAIWQNRRFLAHPMARYVALGGFLVFELLAWMPQLDASDKVVFLAAIAAGTFLYGLWNTPIDRYLPARVCSFAGRLSYPIFLLHWPVGAMVWSMTGIVFGWRLLALSGGTTIAIAALVVVLFEMPIERLRAGIRANRVPLAPTLPVIADVTSVVETSRLGADLEVSAQAP
jgi:peptidoglycan/LPS O-acetylase OafA/YrhL